MKFSSLILKLVLLLMLGLNVIPAGAETMIGRVIQIEDGDTITILDGNNHQQKVRLADIDAPDRLQAFGAHSQANLSSLLFDQEAP